MSKGYVKVIHWRTGKAIYKKKGAKCYRVPSTAQELRENAFEVKYRYQERLKYKIRRTSPSYDGKIIDAWNDKQISRNWIKSWKDRSKKHKQWESD